jgi:hypothetical protein
VGFLGRIRDLERRVDDLERARAPNLPSWWRVAAAVVLVVGVAVVAVVQAITGTA